MPCSALHRLFLAPAVPSSLCALAGLRGRLVAETRTLFRRCALLRLAVLLLAVGVFKILIVTGPLVIKLLLLLGRVVLLVPLSLPLALP